MHIDLFSGMGGFALAAKWAGFKTVVMCEINEKLRGFLEAEWRVPVIPDIREFIVACEEFVHIAKNERFLRVTQDVSRAIQHILVSGENDIQKSDAGKIGNITGGESKKFLTTTGGNVSAAGKIEWSSCVWIMLTIMGQKSGRSITIPPFGRSQLREDCQTIFRYYVITATTQNKYTAYVHIKRPTILSAGVPCQPASLAGNRRGEEDPRWLWGEAIAACRYINPTWALFENPPGIITMGLDGILADLEGIGYEVGLVDIPACAVDSPQLRHRVWIVAHRNTAYGEVKPENEICSGRNAPHDGPRCGELAHRTGQGPQGAEPAGGTRPDGRSAEYAERGDVGNGDRESRKRRAKQYEPGCQEGGTRDQSCGATTRDVADGNKLDRRCRTRRQDRAQVDNGSHWSDYEWIACADGKVRRTKPGLGGLVDGISARIRRPALEALGNAIVPQVAYEIMLAIKESEA